MEIKKNVQHHDKVVGGYVCYGGSTTEFYVHYKGFVASGPDLGACIGRCYAAANQETV